VARSWREYCRGYAEDPGIHLSRTFEEVGGYDEIVVLKDIPFQSHCEHHMAPITGTAAIAYLPTDRVVGISKLARVLHGYASRLQVQERLTAQVAQTIWDTLRPQGVAVVIEAQHGCMTGRGVKTHGVGMVTSRMLGCFRDNPGSRKEVLSLINTKR
jgi:GTP cyclohydrolase I